MNSSYQPTGREIAQALGVSPSRVSQLKRDGMPVESVEAAQAWYRRRVDVARSFGQRNAAGRRPVAADDGDARMRAEALGTAAHYALSAGRFGEVEAELRAALRAVPPADRARLELPADVLDALSADVLAAVHEFDDEADREPMSDKDVEWLGDFWYRVAAGEVVPRD